MSREEIVCKCKEVTRDEIIKAIKKQGLKTVEEVGKATEAGTGCGGCQKIIQKILDKVNG